MNQVFQYRKRSSRLETEIKVNQTLILLTGLFRENDLCKTLIRSVRFPLPTVSLLETIVSLATVGFFTTSAQVSLVSLLLLPSHTVPVPTIPVEVRSWFPDRFSPTLASDEPVEFSADDTRTNLTARFDQEHTPNPRAPSSLQAAAAATPLTSNTMSHHTLPSSRNTQNLPAPLDPQYTTDTGPAGARDP